MYTHMDYPPSRPGHAEDGQGQAGFSTGTAGLVSRFGPLPFPAPCRAGRRTLLVAATAGTDGLGWPCLRPLVAGGTLR
jgi:hypothetical protein